MVMLYLEKTICYTKVSCFSNFNSGGTYEKDTKNRFGRKRRSRCFLSCHQSVSNLLACSHGNSSVLALCALLRTIDSFRLFDKVNLLTGGGPANTTATITQYLCNYGIKNLNFGFGTAGALIMTILVLILSSFYIKRAMS